jgi:hypothetical protein
MRRDSFKTILAAGGAMEFDDAIAAHTQWKHKIRRSLAKDPTSLNPADVSVDHNCSLGMWIYGEGANYRGLPEYVKLKYEHARFHLVTAELVKRAHAGESIDAEMAPCASSEFSASSSAVIMAIVTMKKSLSN